MTELIKAIRKNNLQKVLELLKDNANPNEAFADGITPLGAALGNKNESIFVALLLAFGANPNVELKGSGKYLLHDVLTRGTSQTAILFIGFGADQTVNDCFGRTPLEEYLRKESFKC